MILAVDPGAHRAGAALIRPAGLVAADTIGRRGGGALELARAIRRWAADQGWDGRLVVAEIPTGRGGRGAPTGDLISVALGLGAILGALNPEVYQLVTPARWKGTVPKNVQQPRIWAGLTEAERARVRGDHNAVDAVGIALWAAGRRN